MLPCLLHWAQELGISSAGDRLAIRQAASSLGAGAASAAPGGRAAVAAAGAARASTEAAALGAVAAATTTQGGLLHSGVPCTTVPANVLPGARLAAMQAHSEATGAQQKWQPARLSNAGGACDLAAAAPSTSAAAAGQARAAGPAGSTFPALYNSRAPDPERSRITSYFRRPDQTSAVQASTSQGAGQGPIPSAVRPAMRPIGKQAQVHASTKGGSGLGAGNARGFGSGAASVGGSGLNAANAGGLGLGASTAGPGLGQGTGAVPRSSAGGQQQQQPLQQRGAARPFAAAPPGAGLSRKVPRWHTIPGTRCAVAAWQHVAARKQARLP